MTTMRAAQFDAYGAPDVLHVAQVPRPARHSPAGPGPGRGGRDQPARPVHPLRGPEADQRTELPLGTGIDFAGEVVETAGAADFAAGQRVWGSLPAMKRHRDRRDRGLRRRRRRPDRARPTRLTAVEAASLVVTGTTALRAIQDIAGTTAGQRVLIRGAAGGVGLAAVQIAAALRAEVTTLTSGKDREALQELGATHTLDYRGTAWTSSAASTSSSTPSGRSCSPTAATSPGTGGW